MFSKIKATKQSRNTRHISTSFPSQIARAKARSESRRPSTPRNPRFPSFSRLRIELSVFCRYLENDASEENFEWKNLPHSPLSRNWLNIERKKFRQGKGRGVEGRRPEKVGDRNLSIGTEDMAKHLCPI